MTKQFIYHNMYTKDSSNSHFYKQLSDSKFLHVLVQSESGKVEQIQGDFFVSSSHEKDDSLINTTNSGGTDHSSESEFEEMLEIAKLNLNI